MLRIERTYDYLLQLVVERVGKANDYDYIMILLFIQQLTEPSKKLYFEANIKAKEYPSEGIGLQL